jgi:hypothetical protein
MAFERHTIETPPGADRPILYDRIIYGRIGAVANAAGSGAGASVTTAVSGLELPASYTVVIMPSQDAVWYITNKTQSGFSVVMNPRLAANTLAIGTFDVLIFA